MAGFEHHPGLDRLAAVGIRDTRHGRLGHLRVGRQDFFHLARPDFHAARFDQFLLAVQDVEIPIGIHAGDIAGVQPAIPQRLGGFLGHIVVAQHDLRTLDDQLAGLSDRHFGKAILQADDFCIHVRERQADRAEPVFALQWIAMRGSRRFGQAVAFQDAPAGELLEFLLGLSSSSGAEPEMQALMLVRSTCPAATTGAVVDGVVECGGGREIGDMLGLDGRQQLRDIARVRE